jgi:glycosyltransferase involved in cell wall biosynthesis
MTSLSLIVPIYNGGDFIDNLTGHIVRLHQAVAGIEFILVNDGSTDTTSRQLHAFFNNHAHLNLNYQLLEQENGGVSSARNRALQVAGGEYVMFMDHDDNIDVDKLAPLFEKMRASGADLVQFNCSDHYHGDDNVFDRDKYLIDFPFFSSVWGYIYKLDIICENRLQFIVGMKYLEDGVFLLQYILKSRRIMVSNSRIYDYVDNPDSVMRAKRNAAQNQKYLDDIGRAVREYSDLAGQPAEAAANTRLKEIRDSFMFIYIVNMLKINVPQQELLQRLQAVDYNFKLANYPSKFNNRLPIRLLCHVFRSKRLLGLFSSTNALNKLRHAV